MEERASLDRPQPFMQPNIQELFTDISASYDTVNHWLSLGQDLAWRKRAVARLPWPSETPITVLDLCAGTLDFGLILKKRYPHAVIHSLDFSMGMLKMGRRKLSPSTEESFPLYCADAEQLPFRSEQFDLVLSAYGMRNIHNQGQSIGEISRVLKKDGYIGILEFFNPTNLFSKFFYKTYGAYILPLVGGWISKRTDAYRYLQKSILNYSNLKDYINFIESKNFKINIFQDFIGGISSFILAKNSLPCLKV